MNGKGDTPRPVDRKRFEANYDAIRWGVYRRYAKLPSASKQLSSGEPPDSVFTRYRKRP